MPARLASSSKASGMDITELVGFFDQTGAAVLPVDDAYCAANAIECSAPAATFYVEPTLTRSREAKSPAVILIDAPAAVGKTALARHLQSKLLAAKQMAIYIPLQNANIGEDFFTGRLAGIFLNTPKLQILEHLFSGKVILIFDGYDEVTMRSDQVKRNRMFISEVARELDNYERRGGNTKPSIVFLFRSVFSEFGVFEPIEERAHSLRVDFFNQLQQKRFLASYLNSKASHDKTSSKAHLASDFLDGFEARLSGAKAGAPQEAAAFFGHAIVLSAFGDYLHEQVESNAARLAEALSDQVADEDISVRILDTVIKRILGREVSKFPALSYSATGPGFEGYSAEKQERLLCAVAEDLFRGDGRRANGEFDHVIEEVVAELQAVLERNGLPAQEREPLVNAYEQELRNRVSHHPFVDVPRPGCISFRNPVYREYYLARSAALNVDRNWDALAQAKDASHYLALFFLHHIGTRDLQEYSGFLFHFISLLATASAAEDFLFQLTWDEERSAWLGSVYSDAVRINEILLGDPCLVLMIPRRGVLQNVVVEGRATGTLVEIAGPGPEFAQDDPIVLRDCKIEADDVTFRIAPLRFDGVNVRANSIAFDEITARIEGCETVSFDGFVAPPRLTLSKYVDQRWGRVLRGAVTENSPSLAEFARKLGKLLLWFRKHKRPEYGCYDKKFQTCALNGNRDQRAVALADFLFGEELLLREPGLIIMNQTAFSSFDVAYVKQNELQLGPRAAILFTAFQASPYWPAFLSG